MYTILISIVVVFVAITFRDSRRAGKSTLVGGNTIDFLLIGCLIGGILSVGLGTFDFTRIKKSTKYEIEQISIDLNEDSQYVISLHHYDTEGRLSPLVFTNPTIYKSSVEGYSYIDIHTSVCGNFSVGGDYTDTRICLDEEYLQEYLNKKL